MIKIYEDLALFSNGACLQAWSKVGLELVWIIIVAHVHDLLLREEGLGDLGATLLPGWVIVAFGRGQKGRLDWRLSDLSVLIRVMRVDCYRRGRRLAV